MKEEKNEAAGTTLMIHGQTGERPVTKKDIEILENLYSVSESCRNSKDELGMVLEDLVSKLDYDGKGVEIHLLHSVAEVHRFLRNMVYAFDGLTPEF